MEKRLLITGVSGFAGRYLAPLMVDSGYRVFGTVHSDAELKQDGVEVSYQVDLRDFNALRHAIQSIKPTHVVHLAAISFVAHENINEIYETNIVGSRNLLKSLDTLEVKPDAILLTSSANVYGISSQSVFSEIDEVNPANDYAVSKLAMEYMSRQFLERLNIIIARPFNYTGRGQSENFLIPKIVNHFKKGADFIELGNTDVSRDFSDVRTVVEYMKRLIETPACIANIYNICSGAPHSLDHIIKTCEKITGRNVSVRVNPSFVRRNEIKTLSGNPQKLINSVGFVNKHPIEETLAWMLNV
ncbi:GDP-mannose 4,6-dehydratase [Asticcacaulis sp. SL142]|uniref:GDP-mannose 4,6-dehydratase n=1 Tax=Asticcacaulis sp. SL142 TaxID=2995155 RepID=UPI00226D0322|nr:GDP-mannose 4,6-dehydratase [Asticcacaulis sp. SL142]WAC47058.1 GDP-mannose 4,6-dehydratase [Asticcacaulis sp. SL142]